MAEPIPPRGPLQGLADLSQELTRPSRMPTFVRGLVVGAFVGAAIAGSALLRRRAKGAGGANTGSAKSGSGPSGSAGRQGPEAR